MIGLIRVVSTLTDEQLDLHARAIAHLVGEEEILTRAIPDQPTGSRADRDRSQHRRREQAHEHADPAAPAGALAAQVVAGVGHHDLPVGVLADEDHPLARHLLGTDPLDQSVELGLRRARVLVGGDQQLLG